MRDKKINLGPLIGISVLLIVAFGTSGYFFYQTKKTKAELEKIKSQQPASQEEAKALKEKVGKLAILPDEMPTIATVTDLEKVKDRPFFAGAKNGDKVLIFPDAKKAVLYDPTADKIVNIAPLNLNDQDNQQALAQVQGAATSQKIATAAATPTTVKIRFLLRNGTDVAGLTRRYDDTLLKIIPDAIIVDRENAAHQNYEQTIIVAIEGTDDQTKQLSKILGIKPSSLPDDEEKPGNVDFLIILGADKKDIATP